MELSRIRFTENDFFARYKSVLGEWVIKRGNHAEASYGIVSITRTQYIELEELLREWEEFDRKLSIACELNNKGIELEKRGEINDAISTYERNILPDVRITMHPYDRLLVIYRKNKDYQNELRICKQATQVFPKENKYKERLIKIKGYITKQNN